MKQIFEKDIEASVKNALIEDLGGELNPSLDITAQLIPKDKIAQAKIISREEGILCGKQWAESSFQQVDNNLDVIWHAEDGQRIHENQKLASINGSARAILTAERTALNFLQMLSGTATLACHYASILEGSSTQILDTRKTIPGLRLAQKYAVKCGGGQNHRIGLFDAFLIKENHIHACGGITNAVANAKQIRPLAVVEIEVENLDELAIAINAGADIIMLDNFDTEQIRQAVSINVGRCKLEVSGNITDERLSELANLGVDFISSGALTKHLKALDLSLLIE